MSELDEIRKKKAGRAEKAAAWSITAARFGKGADSTASAAAGNYSKTGIYKRGIGKVWESESSIS